MQQGQRVGLVVVDWGVTTLADGRDHFVLARIAFAGRVLLDRADRNALVRNVVMLTPRGQVTEIAAAEGIDLGQASKMSRLAQLAPDLIEAIALGRLDVGVSQLLRGRLSACWLAQREALVADSH